MQNYATTEKSDTKFMLIFLKECRLVNVSGISAESILHLEAVLHERANSISQQNDFNISNRMRHSTLKCIINETTFLIKLIKQASACRE
jgi:hypothetical protein